jgi:CRISPR/Cas system CMR-associated protein Cmr1 (group 7 of RAMP superfamily)
VAAVRAEPGEVALVVDDRAVSRVAVELVEAAEPEAAALVVVAVEPKAVAAAGSGRLQITRIAFIETGNKTPNL